MKRFLFGGLVGILLLGCGGNDDETEDPRELCAQYCDKVHECDTTGTVTDAVTDACKTVCEEIYGEEDSEAGDDRRVSCATEESCQDFRSCLAGHGDEQDGEE